MRACGKWSAPGEGARIFQQIRREYVCAAGEAAGRAAPFRSVQ